MIKLVKIDYLHRQVIAGKFLVLSKFAPYGKYDQIVSIE